MLGLPESSIIKINNEGNNSSKDNIQKLFKAPKNLSIKKFNNPKRFQTKMELSKDERRSNIGK
jgi:hypothetical protein